MTVMSETLPLARVKAKFSEMVDRVEHTHDRIIVTRNGRPAAVLISPEELDSLEDTLVDRICSVIPYPNRPTSERYPAKSSGTNATQRSEKAQKPSPRRADRGPHELVHYTRIDLADT